MNTNRPTYISLFSSAGIGCYGFKLEGFECVATNELITRRLDIQRFNNKFKYDSGYICGDITEDTTKEALYLEGIKYGSLWIIILLVINLITKNITLLSTIYYIILLLTSTGASVLGINKKKS